jgi:hypothetical protein
MEQGQARECRHARKHGSVMVQLSELANERIRTERVLAARGAEMLEPVVEIVFDARAADQDWRGVMTIRMNYNCYPES